MKLQNLVNGHWKNNQTDLKNLGSAREALRQVFCRSWENDEMQKLDDGAHDKATTAEIGEIVIGATGTKWRIAD